MRRKVEILASLTLTMYLLLFGCKQDIPPSVVATAELTKSTSSGNKTAQPITTSTPEVLSRIETEIPSPIKTKTSSPTSFPSFTFTPSPSPNSPPPCSAQLCTYEGHFYLSRPIEPLYNDRTDTTYRYGSTQDGQRPTHHGVEFVNEEGIPVLASADGVVVVAGSDSQQAFADYPFYYGNLVIIEHNFPQIDEPIFSLYGHLSDVLIEEGNIVKTGDVIGLVGHTGVADWSHLHFEVRAGENRFYDTRNPELWIQPHEDSNGELKGALAGRIMDEYGTPIHIPNIVIERFNDSGKAERLFYVESYADFSVNGDDEWKENFAVGDLPPGKYRVSFVARGLQTWEVMVYPGQVTVFVFDAGEE
jgi:murein DD-endopeptidase MepM/ murein hydrolase activator NlpD